MKEGGSLFGGTCEHCEDRAPSGPRQDSVRTLSGLSGQLRELHKPGFIRLGRDQTCSPPGPGETSARQTATRPNRAHQRRE